MTPQTQQTDSRVEDEVLAVIDAVRAAHAARDAQAIMACYDSSAVRYTLAPPLQQDNSTDYGDAAGLQKWLATFDGPVELEHCDLRVTACGDLALVHALTRMTATPTGTPDSFTLWYRSTLGLSRMGGGWRIVHQHDSTPFYMDGSFRAAVDLQPPATDDATDSPTIDS